VRGVRGIRAVTSLQELEEGKYVVESAGGVDIRDFCEVGHGDVEHNRTVF